MMGSCEHGKEPSGSWFQTSVAK